MAGLEKLSPPSAAFLAAADLQEQIDAWRQWLATERRASSHSLSAYERDLAAFLAFLAEIPDGSEVYVLPPLTGG